MSPDAWSVILRTLSLLAVLQAAGIAVYLGLFRGNLREATKDIRRVGTWSAAIALVLLAMLLILEPARMAGDFSGILDPSLQRLLLASSAALSVGVRLAGVILLLAGLSRVSPVGAVSGVAGALLVTASFALTGHTSVNPWRPLLAPALMTHVFIAELWFGAIPALYLVTLREVPDVAARAIEAFSKLAIWAVPALAIAGALMALLLVRHLAAFREPYGWLLLAKILGFTLLMGFAAANRLRLGPAVALGVMRPFRRSLAAEYLLLVGVLTATATMTSLYSPE
jgi:copper resistance protein D